MHIYVRKIWMTLALVGLLLATGITLLANILADIGYAWLDPRIHYRVERGA